MSALQGLRATFAGVLSVCALVGCASQSPERSHGQRVQTQITTFHELPNATALSGRTFAMVPIGDQEGDLQWKTYASDIAEKLSGKGLYLSSGPSSGTDLAVIVSYSVDGGRTTTSAAPIFGQTGGGGLTSTSGSIGAVPFNATSYSLPTYGLVGYGPVSETTFGRALKVQIFDLKSGMAKSPQLIYGAAAVSAGYSGNINVVMRSMIDAMFLDWPSRSGSTVTVNTPLR